MDLQTDPPPPRYSAFADQRLIARGDLACVARAVCRLAERHASIFEDATGRPVDLDLRGSEAEVVARLAPQEQTGRPTRGRPKLGVTAREVTLLPRHWTWLADQPGGASAALRRLVDDARRGSSEADNVRHAREAAYRVMTSLAGNLPNYEEAVRALFASDLARLAELTAAWPTDVMRYVGELAAGGEKAS